MCDFRKKDSPNKQKKSRGEKKSQVCLGEFSICVDFLIGRAWGLESAVCIMKSPGAWSVFTFDPQRSRLQLGSLLILLLIYFLVSWWPVGKNHKLSLKPTNSVQIAMLNTFRWQSDLAIINLRWVNPCNIEGQGHPISLPAMSALLHMSPPLPHTLGFSFSWLEEIHRIHRFQLLHAAARRQPYFQPPIPSRK